MEKKENKIEYKREIIKSNIEPSIAFELIKMIEKAQEYDKLTTMDKKLMQMSEDGKGFQVVRNAKGEPFQVIKQEEYMRLVDIENKYDNLVSGESKVIKELDNYIEKPNYIVGNRNDIALPKHVIQNALFVFKAQAKELEELKKAVRDIVEDKTITLMPRDNDDSLYKKWNKLKQLCKEEVKE